MLESDADRREYLSAFGVPCSCASGTFSGVFDDDYADAGGLEDSNPILTLPTVDAVRLGITAKQSALLVAGVAYRVLRHEPDGQGMSRLILQS